MYWVNWLHIELYVVKISVNSLFFLSAFCVNQDLQALMDWGADNRTTFETKKHTRWWSQRRSWEPLIPRESWWVVVSDVKQVKEMKLVGFTFDAKLTRGAIIGALAKNWRQGWESTQFGGWLALWTRRTCSRCTRLSWGQSWSTGALCSWGLHPRTWASWIECERRWNVFRANHFYWID